MALETRVPTYQRLRYFNGLFLFAADFETEAEFHVATRRHLNYLLFLPGVLADSLAVSADGTTTITVAAGSAMVPDRSGDQQLHEVHLATATPLDLASPDVGASDGDTVYVTLGFHEEDVFSTPAGGNGGGSPPSEEDRRQEEAVLTASITAPALTDAVIVLAEVTYHPAGVDPTADPPDVVDRRVRGGLRYEILSQDLIDRLGPVAVPPPTITGIDPPGGEPGTTYDPVVVTGTNLTSASAVTFQPAAGLTVTDLRVLDSGHLSFSLAVQSGAAAGPRRFQVTTPGGTARSEDFGVPPFAVAAVVPSSPTIDEVNPSVAVQGATLEVQVSGSNLTGAAVTFQPAAGLTVNDLEVVDDGLLRFTLVVGGSAVAGSRTLRVTTSAGTASHSFEVTAAQVLESITITAERPAIAVGGDQVQMTATGHFTSGPEEDLTAQVSWTSSDTSIATVEAGTGRVTSVGPGTTLLQATLDGTTSETFLLVVGVAMISSWPTDADRRARGTETLRIFGERFVNPLQVSFTNAVTGGERVVVDGNALSLTEAEVVVPGPLQPIPTDPALVRSGRIRVITTAGESANSPQNFILETL